jgi:hypothetical protein
VRIAFQNGHDHLPSIDLKNCAVIATDGKRSVEVVTSDHFAFDLVVANAAAQNTHGIPLWMVAVGLLLKQGIFKSKQRRAGDMPLHRSMQSTGLA